MAGEPQQPTRPASGLVFHEPTRGPSASTPRDIADWDALVAGSLDRAKDTAEKWRTGLAAFVTLITGLLLLKGPEQASDIATPWNLVVIGALVAGGMFAVFALWQALEAAAPSNFSSVTLPSVIRDYGSVQARNVSVAAVSLGKLRNAKRLMVPSLALIAAAVIVWWGVQGTPTTYVNVTGKTSVCGVLEGSSQGSMTVRAAGQDAETLDLVDVTSIRIVTKC